MKLPKKAGLPAFYLNVFFIYLNKKRKKYISGTLLTSKSVALFFFKFGSFPSSRKIKNAYFNALLLNNKNAF
jgi:hypothetical protein